MDAANQKTFATLDAEFKEWGTPLLGRPLAVFKRLYGVVTDPLERQALFDPIITWFIDTYGEDARWDGVLGKLPILIRGVLYQGLAMYAFEERPGIYKEHILDLPKHVSDTFDAGEFRSIAERLSQARASFGAIYNLSIEDHCLSEEEKQLFHMGMRDLESATALLIHTKNVQASIVTSHEAAEKFLKIALLRSSSKKRPRAFSHDIPSLFNEVAAAEPRYRWLVKPTSHLQKLSPNMEMRYRQMQRTEEDAVSAFTAALHVCGVLANIWLFDNDRGGIPASFVPDRFYRSSFGRSFYCKTVKGQQACLMLFSDHPLYGRQLADMNLNILESSLYLEIKDPQEQLQFRNQLLGILRSPMRRVTPDEVALRTTDTDEGTYTTMMIRQRFTKTPVH